MAETLAPCLRNGKSPAQSACCTIMYGDFWGFRKDPFSLIADTALVCRSEVHNRALASLIHGVHLRKGLIVLTAEPGMGKTTLLYCLREFLETQAVECLFLYNSRINADQFWELIGSNVSPRSSCNSKIEVLQALQDLAVHNARAGTVLIVDEAQNFGSDVLEEIRLLGNLENRRGKLLQIVLAGQPEFETRLDASDLHALKQRVVRRCSLLPFKKAQTHDYICARLERAGVPLQTIFPDDVIAQLHVCSRGIPRLINTLGDNLLVTAFALNTKVTTLDMLEAVSRDLRLSWDTNDPAVEMIDSQVHEDHQSRIDVAALIEMGVLPSGFAEVSEPTPRKISVQLELFGGRRPEADTIVFNPEPRGESSIPAIRGQIKIQSATIIASKAMHTVASHVLNVGRHVANNLRISAQAAIEHRRVTMGLLSTVLGLSIAVAYSAPISYWFRSLSLLASPHTRRSDEIIRAETYPVPSRRPAASGNGTDTGPRALRIGPAEYTPSARYARFQGKVFVIATVNTQGKVIQVEFAAPTAFDLDVAVREAAQGWLFKPAIRNGQKVESRTLVQVPFR